MNYKIVGGKYDDGFCRGLSLSMLIKNSIDKHHTSSTAYDSTNSTSQRTTRYTQQAFTRVNQMEKCQHNQQEDATFLLTVNCKKIRLRNVTL